MQSPLSSTNGDVRIQFQRKFQEFQNFKQHPHNAKKEKNLTQTETREGKRRTLKTNKRQKYESEGVIQVCQNSNGETL